MSNDDMEDELAGDKYFNKYSLIPYTILIMVVMLDVEPEASVFKLLVGAGFFIIWTFLAGIMATIFVVLPLAKLVKQEEFIYEYFLWVPPVIGFSCFLAALYG